MIKYEITGGSRLERLEPARERHARGGQIGTKAIQGEDSDGNQNLLPELRNAERICDSL